MKILPRFDYTRVAEAILNTVDGAEPEIEEDFRYAIEEAKRAFRSPKFLRQYQQMPDNVETQVRIFNGLKGVLCEGIRVSKHLYGEQDELARDLGECHSGCGSGFEIFKGETLLAAFLRERADQGEEASSAVREYCKLQDISKELTEDLVQAFGK